MLQNKRNVKTKVSPAAEDAILLKKLPGLLAICEFILIPVLIVAPFSRKAPEGDTLPPPQDDAPPTASSGAVEIAAITDIPLQSSPLPKQVIQVTVTAYSSTVDQTDSTPFHTANGKDVEDGIVAANFLPLGTQLRIPEVFGEKIFTVEDRMHDRFERHLDIWMPSRKEAQAFGIQYLTVEIL